MLSANAEWVTLLASLAILLSGAMLIVACVERGTRQAFAVGFIAMMALYLLGVRYTAGPQSPNSFSQVYEAERLKYAAALPTTVILGELWLRIRAPYYVTIEANDPFERYQGPISDIKAQGFGTPFKPPKTPPPGTTGFDVSVLPELRWFLAIGHLLFAFLLGYLGGKFAVAVYRRREARQHSTSTVSSDES